MKSFLIKYLLFSLSIVSLNASATGFVGKLVLEPRNKPYYEVMQDFSFIDKDGHKWTTRKGYKTDGASIPRLLWSVIGDPYGGGYIKSAVIHDQACDDRDRTWQETHRVFFDAMIEEGVNPTKAYIMYAAVYNYGPRWIHKLVNFSNASTDTDLNNSGETIYIQNIPNHEILTKEKLDAITNEVHRLETKGPVSLNDLENLNFESSPKTEP